MEHNIYYILEFCFCRLFFNVSKEDFDIFASATIL